MRDPARIDDALAMLRAAWSESPDLRLGQLLVNAVRPTGPCPEIFYIEDDVLVRKLSELRDQIRTAKSAPFVDRR